MSAYDWTPSPDAKPVWLAEAACVRLGIACPDGAVAAVAVIADGLPSDDSDHLGRIWVDGKYVGALIYDDWTHRSKA